MGENKGSKNSKNENKILQEKEFKTLKPGEVILKMFCSNVFETTLSNDSNLVIDRERIGEVVKVANDVTGFHIGERVSVVCFYESCGNCEYCTTGRKMRCQKLKNSEEIVKSEVTNHCIVPANLLVKVPEGLDSAEANVISCDGVNIYRAIKETILVPGDWLIVAGINKFENLVIQYAKNVFHLNIIAMDDNDDRLKIAKKNGADILINPLIDEVGIVIQIHMGDFKDPREIFAITKIAEVSYGASKSKPSPDVYRENIRVGLPTSMDAPMQYITSDDIETPGSLVDTRKYLKEAFQIGVEGKVVSQMAMNSRSNKKRPKIVLQF